MARETGTPGGGRGIHRIRLSEGKRAEPRALAGSGAAADRRKHARIPLPGGGERDDGGRADSGLAPVPGIGVPAAGTAIIVQGAQQ